MKGRGGSGGDEVVRGNSLGKKNKVEERRLEEKGRKGRRMRGRGGGGCGG